MIFTNNCHWVHEVPLSSVFTWMIVGGAVVVITIVVVGCLITGGGRVAIPDWADGADDATAARMGEGTGVALAKRCEKAAGGRVI